MMEINIGDKKIGFDKPCFIIAEIGSNHNGNIGQAKKLIDVAADSGADAVKFQTFIPERLFNKETCAQAVSMLEKLVLPPEAYPELATYAKEKGLIFMSTAFDAESADFLEGLGVPAHKIASYELTDIPLIRHVAKKLKPVILSTGMATESEIEEAVKCIHSEGNEQVMLLHCVSRYPVPIEEINLKRMESLKAHAPYVGLSDHTTSTLTPAIAVALGAKVIEKHYTLDRDLPGPDHAYALEPDELKEMIAQVRNAESMLGEGKIAPGTAETAEREWRRAIHATRDIAEGTAITEDMVKIVRPAPKGSLQPCFYQEIIGKKIKKDITQGDFLTSEMFDL